MLQHVTFDDVWSNYQQALDEGRLSIPITLANRGLGKPGPSEVDSTEDKLCIVNVEQNDEYKVDLVAMLSPPGDEQNVQQGVEKVRGCRGVRGIFAKGQSHFY